jgi:alpha-L-rhamnosidase
LYHYVAGINIDPEIPGYKHILLAPHPGGGLTNTHAEFTSLYGKIKSSWKIDGNNFVYEVMIPANTTATVSLPSAQISQVTPSVAELKTKLKQEGSNTTIQLGSGTYSFCYPATGLKTN